MKNGIAIYPGLDNTKEENIALIEAAAKAGLTRLFTSLQIPETDVEKMKAELSETLQTAREAGMEIISDVSPRTLELLDISSFSPHAFQALGISVLRLDDGFSPEEIAQLSHEKSLHLSLNAATMTTAFLSALRNAGADFNHVDAIYNFYPREGTGLSAAFVAENNALLHSCGIRTAAFLPSFHRPRGPLFAGLPTVEAHRKSTMRFAARHLVALGTDSLFLADSLPRTDELAFLGSLKGDCITLDIELFTKDSLTKALLQEVFTSRLDEAAYAIRAQESRAQLKALGGKIAPENTAVRDVGCITLDNAAYGRYMGELQIIRTAQARDARTNVVAKVKESDRALLSLIHPGKKFAFSMA